MNALYNAAIPLEMQGVSTPPLTPEEKAQWNLFIDYLDKKGLRGSADLDARDKGLGARLMSEYQKVNPDFKLGYDRIADVQQDLQNYRKQLVNDYNAGKIQADATVKTADDIMPGLSKIDGWLGSKTSSYKFPTAKATVNGKQTNYGTNVAAYDAAMASLKQK